MALRGPESSDNLQVSRIVEFRLQRYSDRASIFRGKDFLAFPGLEWPSCHGFMKEFEVF